MQEIEKAFNTSGNSVYEFYQRPGIGFYIPLYQREYSWDKENIEQLLEDIEGGINRLCEADNENEEIRFLGTIITVSEKDVNKIEPVDKRGLPSVIEKVIDGQQRLSSICLISAILLKKIYDIENKLKKDSALDEIKETCHHWRNKLIDVVSLDLKRGNPTRKPKIIRGHDDKWVKDGLTDEAYKSDLANFLAHAINHFDDNNLSFPKFKKSNNVGKNARQIDKWLDNDVIAAHTGDYDGLNPAWEILAKMDQKYIWSYERDELTGLVNLKEVDNKKSNEFFICSLVQIFAVCHYLLERCCFTLIQPSNDDWAFDMFQSLNASGTPLTALEVFKPLVVNTHQLCNKNIPFKNCKSDISFRKVENLFEDTSSAAQKSKRTNDFLASFAIVMSGDKLTSHFSNQRKWLEQQYSSLEDYKRKTEFVEFMGNYSDFFKTVWLDYKGVDNQPLSIISTNEEASLISTLLLFLKESNHKMGITILAFFYDRIQKGEEHSVQDFIESIKAVSSFYILWRSSLSNSGLDNIYRQFFKGNDEHKSRCWKSDNDLTIKDLKDYFKSILKEKDIYNKEKWIGRSSRYLSYRSKSIVKFLLLNAAHDTIPDPERPGLLKYAKQGTSEYLKLKMWYSDVCKTVEHIAPQSSTNEWCETLYDDDEAYQKIGNLTLLPINVNSSVGKKGWSEKLIYYKHLSEKDLDKITELAQKAKSQDIDLSKETIDILRKAPYGDHIKHLTIPGNDINWNKEFVESRSNNILDLGYDRLIKWLS